MTKPRLHRKRRGISILEVIACTGMVTVMIIPIAGVVRASSQSIAHASGSVVAADRMRSGLQWLCNTVRDSDIVSINRRRLTIRRPDNTLQRIEVRRGNLVLREGSTDTILITGVRRVNFQQLRTSSRPRTRTGVSIRVEARENGKTIAMTSTVSEIPQI